MPDDANALAPSVWPERAHRDDDGVLVVGGIPATDAARAVRHAPVRPRRGRGARPCAPRTLAAFRAAAAAARRAGRACTTRARRSSRAEVVRWVTEEGLAVDVCTGGELAVALAAGADPARLGLPRQQQERRRARARGRGRRRLDRHRQRDRDRAPRRDRRAPRRLQARAGAREQRRARRDARLPRDRARGSEVRLHAEDAASRRRAHPRDRGLDFVGLHCHIGSQIFGTAGFRESAARLVELHAELLAGGDIPVLNLGGGFGIAYTVRRRPDADRGARARASPTPSPASARVRGIPMPNLAFEPGRAIVGQAGVTLYEVGTTKPVAGRRRLARLYVSVDGGMSDNARPALYGAQYSARLASRVSDAEPALVRVVGKHCESGDIVVDAEYLPGDVAPGDLAGGARDRRVLLLAREQLQLRPAPAGRRRARRRRHASSCAARRVDDLLARDAGLDADATPTSKGRHDRLPPPASRAPRRRSRRLPGRRAAARARRRARRPRGRHARARRHRGARHRRAARGRPAARAAHDGCRDPHHRLRHRHRAHGRHRARAHATCCRRSTPAPTS